MAKKPTHSGDAAAPEHEVAVRVEPDHLKRLAGMRPILAVAELVWNSLDADATTVRVNVDRNRLDGIAAIRITDDGQGMTQREVDEYFGRLGGSWKRLTPRTPSQRVLHGKDGEGRFRAFALGTRVEWLTRSDGDDVELTVVADASRPTKYLVRRTSGRMPHRGTVVIVTNCHERLPGLSVGPAVDALTERFALYLHRYPRISLSFDDEPVDPGRASIRTDEYPLEITTDDDGGTANAKLTIIEWRKTAERSLCLCDQDGFALLELPVNKRIPGYNFTAYLSSDIVRVLAEAGSLGAEELHPVVARLARAARDKIGEHFRARRAGDAKTRVDRWKTENVYPYPGTAASQVELVERQVFEVCAADVEALLPDFEAADQKTRALTFRLLRQAVERSPADMQRILGEVLDLPAQKQQQFAKLLHRTTLAAIINASSMIADRLEFLSGLENVLFDPDLKGLVKERTQLHRLLAENTWIFGEEFHLTADDEGLTAVLAKHLGILDKDRKKLAPVVTPTGSPLIVDLMLSRRIPLPKEEERQHLVIELKRPTVKIDSDVLTQVKKYAGAVVTDERFRETKATWTFWAVSNEMDRLARSEARQALRPPGLIHQDGELPLTIWAKTWGEILDDCRGRLSFYQKQLEYQATRESGTKYLQEVHAKVLPPLQQSETEPASSDPGVVTDAPATDDGADGDNS